MYLGTFLHLNPILTFVMFCSKFRYMLKISLGSGKNVFEIDIPVSERETDETLPDLQRWFPLISFL